MPTNEATVPWFTIEADGTRWQWKLWAVGGKKICEAKGFRDVAECVDSITQVKKTAGSPVEWPPLLEPNFTVEEGLPA